MPPLAALIDCLYMLYMAIYIWQCASIPDFYLFFLRKAIPDLVPMAEKRTED